MATAEGDGGFGKVTMALVDASTLAHLPVFVSPLDPTAPPLALARLGQKVKVKVFVKRKRHRRVFCADVTVDGVHVDNDSLSTHASFFPAHGGLSLEAVVTTAVDGGSQHGVVVSPVGLVVAKVYDTERSHVESAAERRARVLHSMADYDDSDSDSDNDDVETGPCDDDADHNCSSFDDVGAAMDEDEDEDEDAFAGSADEPLDAGGEHRSSPSRKWLGDLDTSDSNDDDDDDDGSSGSGSGGGMSEYERERAKRIKENEFKMKSLGLGGEQTRKRPAEKPPAPSLAPKTIRTVLHDECIDEREKKRLRAVLETPAPDAAKVSRETRGCEIWGRTTRVAHLKLWYTDLAGLVQAGVPRSCIAKAGLLPQAADVETVSVDVDGDDVDSGGLSGAAGSASAPRAEPEVIDLTGDDD
jgi:hypothetical protein